MGVSTENQRRIGRALQKLAHEELGKKPSYQGCLNMVKQHMKEAEAAGFYRREEIAAFVFEKRRADLLISAERKEASA